MKSFCLVATGMVLGALACLAVRDIRQASTPETLSPIPRVKTPETREYGTVAYAFPSSDDDRFTIEVVPGLPDNRARRIVHGVNWRYDYVFQFKDQEGFREALGQVNAVYHRYKALQTAEPERIPAPTSEDK